MCRVAACFEMADDGRVRALSISIIGVLEEMLRNVRAEGDK
jgi:hypothetical protein